MRIYVDRHGRPCDSLRHDATALEVVPAVLLEAANEQVLFWQRSAAHWRELAEEFAPADRTPDRTVPDAEPSETAG